MYKGKENLITAIHLQKGEECIVTGFGQSMTPNTEVRTAGKSYSSRQYRIKEK